MSKGSVRRNTETTIKEFVRQWLIEMGSGKRGQQIPEMTDEIVKNLRAIQGTLPSDDGNLYPNKLFQYFGTNRIEHR